MSYDRSAVRAVIEAARAGGRNALSPAECRALCEACAIRLPKAATVSSATEAGRAASAVGFPVVMKIVSPDILHKTEAGGVVLNVRSTAEAERAYEKIVAGARAYQSNAHVAGVEIQQMLSGGQEVIVGATDDPSFGKVVAFGLGGVLVEVLKDITFRLAPASREDALSMINGIGRPKFWAACAVQPRSTRARSRRSSKRPRCLRLTFRKSPSSISTPCWRDPTAQRRSTCACCWISRRPASAFGPRARKSCAR
jgi:hypothetical protein